MKRALLFLMAVITAVVFVACGEVNKPVVTEGLANHSATDDSLPAEIPLSESYSETVS